MRRGFFAWLLAVAVGPIGCSCSSHGAVVDAGFDGGVDAGRDAGRDSGRDAGLDGGALDPGWVRLPGLPDTCDVRIAADPVAAVGMRTFADCADTAPGCRELVMDWPAVGDPPAAYRFRLVGSSGADDGANGYVVFVRPISAERNLLVVLRDDGLPVMAIRGPSSAGTGCFGASAVVNEGHVLVKVALPALADLAPSWLGHAALSDRVTALSYLTTVSYPFDFLQSIGVSGAQGALNTAGTHHVERIAWDGVVTRVAEGRIDSPEWNLDSVVDAAIFYSGYGARNAIYLARGATPGAVFIDPVGAEASNMAADGRDMVWLQSYGRQDAVSFDRVELWASPYTDRAADVVPRMLGTTPFGGPHPVRVGWGAAVVDDDSHVLHLYDLRSGTDRIFRALTTRIMPTGALYVGRSEVAIAAATTAANGDQVIRWIRRDAFE